MSTSTASGDLLNSLAVADFTEAEEIFTLGAPFRADVFSSGFSSDNCSFLREDAAFSKMLFLPEDSFSISLGKLRSEVMQVRSGLYPRETTS